MPGGATSSKRPNRPSNWRCKDRSGSRNSHLVDRGPVSLKVAAPVSRQFRTWGRSRQHRMVRVCKARRFRDRQPVDRWSADVANTHEIVQLQDELYAEVNKDAPHIARGIFGDTSQMPDIAQVSNQRLDDVYRQKYQRNDREWLQAEARRDPQQFLKVAERIGAKIPPPQPPAPPPMPVLPAGPPPTLAPAALAPPPPGPVLAPPMPPVAPVAAIPPVVPMQAAGPAPVILGPNGQPLAPSGAF